MKVKAKALYWLTKYYLKVAKTQEAVNTINKIAEMGLPHS